MQRERVAQSQCRRKQRAVHNEGWIKTAEVFHLRQQAHDDAAENSQRRRANSARPTSITATPAGSGTTVPQMSLSEPVIPCSQTTRFPLTSGLLSQIGVSVI